jgi:predicted ATP-binding protein involved in virulence
MNRIAPLQSIHIENFRGARDLTLELDPKVTVLFGFNAAGKTTLLDALAIGLGAIINRVPRSKGRAFERHGDIRVPHKDRQDVQEKRGVELPYARLTIQAANHLQWDLHKLRWSGQGASGKTVGVSQLHEVLDPLIQAALDSRPEDQSKAPPIPFVAAYGTERAVVAVPLRKRDFTQSFERFAGLDGALETRTRFKSVFEWFVWMEDQERREKLSRLDAHYALPALAAVRRAIHMAGLRCSNPRVETNPNLRMMVDFHHLDGETEALDISSLSDGYRTHFALVVDIARRMVLLNPPDDVDAPDRGTSSEAVILIDEIDLHLDPILQASVLRGLCAAFPNAQFVVSTHSEQVIGTVPAKCVRRLVAGDGEVRVERVPFAEGATSERILIELMGAKERPGQVIEGPVTRLLSTYIKRVGSGQGESAEAIELRAQLDVALPSDSRLHQADLEIHKQHLFRKLAGGGR